MASRMMFDGVACKSHDSTEQDLFHEMENGGAYKIWSTYLHAVSQLQLKGMPKRPPPVDYHVNLHMMRNHWAAGRLLNTSNQVTPPSPHTITLNHPAFSFNSIKMRTAAIRLGSLLSHFQAHRPLLPILFTKDQAPIQL